MGRLLFLFILSSIAAFAWAKDQVELESFVTSRKAFIWARPGYSWTDCRPLGPASAPWNKYRSKEDEELTMKRFNSGAKSACDMRNMKSDLLSAGDAVTLARKDNGDLFEEEHEIIINGELMKKKFYMVTSEKGQIGWMSADQISDPQPKEYVTPRAKKSKKKKKDDCPPHGKNSNPLKGLALQIPEIQNAVDRDIVLGSPKSRKEIDHYMCLYRDSKIDNASFPKMYREFQKSAKQAATAFGVPYGLIMCTMLVESGLHYNPKEKKEYKGLGQFGSDLVADLNQVKERAPYDKMWDRYQKMTHASLSDKAVRSSSNPASSAGAIALSYQWMFWDRLKQSGCTECSIGSNMTRKELYMLVTGYNWGPYALDKISDKTAAEMRSSYPPPKQSRDYMARMENCLEAGYKKSFRDDASRGRPDEAARNKAKRSMSSEQSVAASRAEQCDRQYPVR